MTEEQQKLSGNRPTHRAYLVKDIPNSDRAKWMEIGAAWVHKSGKGFRVKLDAVPANGEAIECVLIDWKKIDAGEPEPRPSEAFDGADGY